VETPIRDPNGGIISNRDLICSIVSGPGCGGSASPLPVELEPPPLPGGERGEGAEKERRSRAQAGAIGALSLTSTPPPIPLHAQRHRWYRRRRSGGAEEGWRSRAQAGATVALPSTPTVGALRWGMRKAGRAQYLQETLTCFIFRSRWRRAPIFGSRLRRRLVKDFVLHSVANDAF
jgi:hypothetical protein